MISHHPPTASSLPLSLTLSLLLTTLLLSAPSPLHADAAPRAELLRRVRAAIEAADRDLPEAYARARAAAGIHGADVRAMNRLLESMPIEIDLRDADLRQILSFISHETHF